MAFMGVFLTMLPFFILMLPLLPILLPVGLLLGRLQESGFMDSLMLGGIAPFIESVEAWLANAGILDLLAKLFPYSF